MVRHPVIKRYLDPERFRIVKRDLLPLVKLINGSGGEYSFQLRENYFNIYYQGNSLAKVIPNKDGTYSVEIHKQFVRDRILEKLEQYSVNKPSHSKTTTAKNSNYARFKIRHENIHQFFQKNNLKRLASKIRAVGYGEEITFEQVLITDNPPSRKLIIIDRQVADHVTKAQMDLLALKRNSEDRPFHFLIIELKLGRNPELLGDVASQLNGYVEHIKRHIDDYIDCYRTNYQQKKQLGLFDPSDTKLPNTIDIEGRVEGLIVVGGYSQLAEQALRYHLCPKIVENRWDIKVQQMTNKLGLDNTPHCEELQK